MAISASFTANPRAVAYPGMRSDASLKNVDGACAADGVIAVGIAVTVTSAQPVDGHKVVKPIAADQVAYGVVQHSHAYSPEFKYEDGSAINIMTHGRIWMATDDTTAPTFGKYVKLAAGGKVAAAGAIATNWTYAGGFAKNPLGAGNMVEVQVLQSSSPVI